MMLTFNDIKKSQEINCYISSADESLKALGYTEHSFGHVELVAHRAADIMRALGADDREIELAMIAGYLHDIGNLVNRTDHSQSGAIMAFRILDNMGMPADEIATVVTAIGNHDEGTGVPVNRVAAALILADKSDVRRSRVRNGDFASFDIHDRVNYSVVNTRLAINKEEKTIRLSIEIDTSISSIMDYFQIFLNRMTLCCRAGERLGLSFKLTINDQSFI